MSDINPSSWSLDPRTVKLVGRCVAAERARDALALDYQLMEQDRDKWKKQAEVMRGCGLVQSDEVELLNSKLKQAQLTADIYIHCSATLRDKIVQLEDVVKSNNRYIDLLGKRLTNALKHLARVRYHCDLQEPADSGARISL